MNGPEAALYSSGPGVKPGGGEPLTVMVTVGAGVEEKERIHCAVIDRDNTCTSDDDNMTSCINQLLELVRFNTCCLQQLEHRQKYGSSTN